ncbi:hypothetical protein BGZ82_003786, partial [Podila clonocystis]
LNLQNNSIGGHGAEALGEALKTNSTLTTLNLESNSIGVDGAEALGEALKTNSTLTTLNLRSNSIGDNGALALSEALKMNSTLTTLDLAWNSIGANGAHALGEALRTNSTLTSLNLGHNKIGPNGTEALLLSVLPPMSYQIAQYFNIITYATYLVMDTFTNLFVRQVRNPMSQLFYGCLAILLVIAYARNKLPEDTHWCLSVVTFSPGEILRRKPMYIFGA